MVNKVGIIIRLFIHPIGIRPSPPWTTAFRTVLSKLNYPLGIYLATVELFRAKFGIWILLNHWLMLNYLGFMWGLSYHQMVLFWKSLPPQPAIKSVGLPTLFNRFLDRTFTQITSALQRWSNWVTCPQVSFGWIFPQETNFPDSNLNPLRIRLILMFYPTPLYNFQVPTFH